MTERQRRLFAMYHVYGEHMGDKLKPVEPVQPLEFHLSASKLERNKWTEIMRKHFTQQARHVNKVRMRQRAFINHVRALALATTLLGIDHSKHDYDITSDPSNDEEATLNRFAFLNPLLNIDRNGRVQTNPFRTTKTSIPSKS